MRQLAALLSVVGLFALAPLVAQAEPAPAPPPTAPKVEKKCDAHGKECKAGKDCQAENCKPAPPK